MLKWIRDCFDEPDGTEDIPRSRKASDGETAIHLSLSPWLTTCPRPIIPSGINDEANEGNQHPQRYFGKESAVLLLSAGVVSTY